MYVNASLAGAGWLIRCCRSALTRGCVISIADERENVVDWPFRRDKGMDFVIDGERCEKERE